MDLVYRGVSPMVAYEICEYCNSIGYNFELASIYQLAATAILHAEDIQLLNVFINRVVNYFESELNLDDSWGESETANFRMKSDFSLNLKSIKDKIIQELLEFVYSDIPTEYKIKLVNILQKVHKTN